MTSSAPSNDGVLVEENRYKLVWVNQIDRKDLAGAFERQGWRVLRIDASDLHSGDEFAAAVARHITNGPDWMRADADGFQYWFLVLFESLMCDRLCVVVDRGGARGPLQHQEHIIGPMLNDLRHTRRNLGAVFTSGERGRWELTVLWISTTEAAPAMPSDAGGVRISLLD